VGICAGERHPARTRTSPRRRAALAVDGKAVRDTRHASAGGQAVHLMAVLDHQACAVLGQIDVDGKTNEISRFRPLLAELDLTGCVCRAKSRTLALSWRFRCSSDRSPVLADKAVDDVGALDLGGHIDRLAGLV